MLSACAYGFMRVTSAHLRSVANSFSGGNFTKETFRHFYGVNDYPNGPFNVLRFEVYTARGMVLGGMASTPRVPAKPWIGMRSYGWPFGANTQWDEALLHIGTAHAARCCRGSDLFSDKSRSASCVMTRGVWRFFVSLLQPGGLCRDKGRPRGAGCDLGRAQ